MPAPGSPAPARSLAPARPRPREKLCKTLRVSHSHGNYYDILNLSGGDQALRRQTTWRSTPGTAQDYEQLISASAEYLHKIRLREPAAIAESERLCLLSLDLVRACPEILARETRYADEDDFPVWLSTAHLLCRLHEDNGDLVEAEQAAVMAAEEFGQRRITCC